MVLAWWLGGTDLKSVIAEMNKLAMNEQKMIEQTITNFEPRARVRKVDVIPNEDNNAYDVRIEFFIDMKTNPITVDFLLERIR